MRALLNTSALKTGVLEWLVDGCSGKAEAEQCTIGYIPSAGSLNTDDWKTEFEGIGDHLPDELKAQHRALGERLGVQVKAES